MSEPVRLQKYLASAGIASRRKAEELIKSGKVRVNGEVVEGLGVKIDPSSDHVAVDGKPVRPDRERLYLLLNKPAGYVTTVKDERGRPAVVDLVGGEVKERVFPIGRLDLETEGLLVLTNDGDLANLLMHPRYHVWKTYRALVKGKVTKQTAGELEGGILLEDGPTAPARLKVVEAADDRSVIEISVREGRKRQVRRMLKAVGHKVEHLERVGYGPLNLGDLKRGEWRFLSATEVEELKAEARHAT
ncbi:MAG: pseudouridine synthase [Candidatus Aquicultorales bacterium]